MEFLKSLLLEPHFWWGALSVLTATTLYAIAWKKQATQNSDTLAIGLLLLAGLMLRFYVAGDTYLHEWDERFHALVAKNMMDHPFRPMLYKTPLLPFNYQDWSTNQIWLHKQPLPLWIMAISMRLFGVHEIALRLPSILLSTGSIWLIFQLGKLLFTSKVAFIAAFLASINGLLIELTGGRMPTDHIDVFFYFFVLLGIFFSVKQVQNQQWIWSIFIGIAMAAAILVKWLPALIIFPVWCLIYWGKEAKISIPLLVNLTIALLSTALFVFPWQLYIYQQFPLEAAWEANFNQKHIFEALDGQTGSYFYHFEKLGRIYGELVYLPLGYLGYQVFRRRSFKYDALLCWILVPLLFFSLVKTKMQAYTLFCAPAIFLSIALCFRALQTFYKKTANRWLKVGIKIFLLLLIALPMRYSIERIKPFDISERRPVWAQQIKDFKAQISLDTTFKDQDIVIFNARHPIATMFYLNRTTAYGYIPTQTRIDSIKRAGYLVVYEKKGTYQLELNE